MNDHDRTEQLLVDALRARADLVTHRTLSPAAVPPPAPLRWRARWVLPVMAAAAAAVVAVVAAVAVPRLTASTAPPAQSSGPGPSVQSGSPNPSPTPTQAALVAGWSQVPAAPGGLGRYGVWTGSVYLDGPTECCGGFGQTATYAYDPQTRTWRTLQPFPLGARNNTGTWTGHELVVAGGAVPAVAGAEKAAATATGAALDPVSGQWHRIANLPEPIEPVFQGWVAGRMVIGNADHTFRYDPASDSWTTGRTVPRLYQGATAAVGGGRLYLYGGANASDGLSRSDGYVYDPAADTWSLLPAAQIRGGSYVGAVWTGTELVVWGGSSSQGANEGGAAFDPASGTWRGIGGPKVELLGSQLAWTGQRLYVRGTPNILLPDASTPPPRTYAYDPRADTWTEVKGAPVTVSVGSLVWTGSQLLGMGGWNQKDGPRQGLAPYGLAYVPSS